MATSPVTIDLSKAQPLPGRVTLDMSKAQPLNAPAPGMKLGFTGEMNPQTRQFEDVSVDQPPQEPAIVRFAEGFNRAVTGAATPEEFADQAASEWQKFNTGAPTPAPFLWQLVSGIHQGMRDTWARAEQEWKGGNWRTATGLISKADAAIHAVESGIPVIGSMLSEADKQMGQGDVAGGAGTLTGIAAPIAAGAIGEVNAMNTGEVINHAPTAATGISRLAPVARTLSDIVDPNLTGIVSPRLANVQRALGRAADALEAKSATPEPKPTTATPPAGAKPVPAAQYFAERKAGASDSTARMMAETANQDAQKAAGNVSSSAARATFLNRPIDTPAQAHQAISDLVTKIAPKAPATTRFQIDYQLRRGDVEQAQKLLQDAAGDNDIQIENRAGLDSDQENINRYKSRLNRAGSSADSNKGSLMSAQQVVDSMPLPGATIEDNKILGYEGRRTIAEATKARSDAMQGDVNAPWGGKFKPYTESVKQFIRLYYGEGSNLKPRQP